jgi:steroid delta-isomerase-like uncharacterized protein
VVLRLHGGVRAVESLFSVAVELARAPSPDASTPRRGRSVPRVVVGRDLDARSGSTASITANDHTRRGIVGNSDTLRRMYELIRAGDLDGFFDHLADDFVEHETGPGLEPTKAGTKQLFDMMTAGFPDLRFDAEDVLESGDKVVARARVTGTNKGDFMGIAASGKSIDIQAIDILQFGADGLAHEHWGVMDIMSLMQQIGAVPQGPPA